MICNIASFDFRVTQVLSEDTDGSVGDAVVRTVPLDTKYLSCVKNINRQDMVQVRDSSTGTLS